MSRAIVACAFLVLITLGGCVSLNNASRRLEQGMTEDQTKAAVGSAPQSVSLQTCGSKTPEPWQCKSYEYRDIWFGVSLVIHFNQDSGVWRVHDWHTY